MRNERRARGFTLVELLVVIGVIALLISILLPALNAARRQAQIVRCLARQHDIAAASNIYLIDHRGHYPLAGVLKTTNTPEGVGDSTRRKYQWHYSTGGYMQMMLWPEAIGMGMGSKIDDFQVATLGTRWALCPSIAISERQNAAFYSTTDNAGFAAPSSYVINEAVFGWDDTMGRLRGKASRVKRPSETMMIMDGLRTMQRGTLVGDSGWMTVTNLTADLPVTLGDALAGNGKAGSPDNFDPHRHGGRMNVLLMDGHAETRRVEDKALDDIFLLAN